jgi:hypothetical protein
MHPFRHLFDTRSCPLDPIFPLSLVLDINPDLEHSKVDFQGLRIKREFRSAFTQESASGFVIFCGN